MKALVLGAALLLVAAGPVMACKCSGAPMRHRVARSVAVFTGRVLETRADDLTGMWWRNVAKVRVLKSWKGPRRGQVVFVSSDAGDCSYDFRYESSRGDSTHLIFADGLAESDTLTTTICHGSRPLGSEWAREMLDSLRVLQRSGLIPSSRQETGTRPGQSERVTR